MPRSWLRNKFHQGRNRIAAKVAERAKTMIPQQQRGSTDTCMVCRRKLKPHRTVAGEGRVCSSKCAQSWAASVE